MDSYRMSCIDCMKGNCSEPNGNRSYPDFCITTHINEEVLKEAMRCYEEPANHRIMLSAAEVEFEHYCKYTRVEEIMAFADKIGARKIGIATCVGLLRESRILADVFRKHGFEVVGIGSKAGSQKKTLVRIPEECNEVGVNMCNPILQATVYKGQLTI